MKTFWITWTYIGNHSDWPIRIYANSEEEAANTFLAAFGKDFQAKAKLFISDKPLFIFSSNYVGIYER